MIDGFVARDRRGSVPRYPRVPEVKLGLWTRFKAFFRYIFSDGRSWARLLLAVFVVWGMFNFLHYSIGAWLNWAVVTTGYGLWPGVMRMVRLAPTAGIPLLVLVLLLVDLAVYSLYHGLRWQWDDGRKAKYARTDPHLLPELSAQVTNRRRKAVSWLVVGTVLAALLVAWLVYQPVPMPFTLKDFFWVLAAFAASLLWFGLMLYASSITLNALGWVGRIVAAVLLVVVLLLFQSGFGSWDWGFARHFIKVALTGMVWFGLNKAEFHRYLSGMASADVRHMSHHETPLNEVEATVEGVAQELSPDHHS
ncbi:MAG: hypothetical protein GC129_02840 [Proteobacteria bacterium]|nr:hypothetical protein [Pseudomonadota bacterium]